MTTKTMTTTAAADIASSAPGRRAGPPRKTQAPPEPPPPKRGRRPRLSGDASLPRALRWASHVGQRLAEGVGCRKSKPTIRPPVASIRQSNGSRRAEQLPEPDGFAGEEAAGQDSTGLSPQESLPGQSFPPWRGTRWRRRTPRIEVADGPEAGIRAAGDAEEVEEQAEEAVEESQEHYRASSQVQLLGQISSRLDFLHPSGRVDPAVLANEEHDLSRVAERT